MTLMNLNDEAFEDWFREFYCNMFDVADDGFKSYVHGKTIFVDADRIGALIQLGRPNHPYYPFPDPENIEYHKNEVAKVLCGAPTEWNSPVLKISSLTSDNQLFNTFVCHNIETRGHTSDLLYPYIGLSSCSGHSKDYT